MRKPRVFALAFVLAITVSAAACSDRGSNSAAPTPGASGTPDATAGASPTNVARTPPTTPSLPATRPSATATPAATLEPAPGGQLIEHGDRGSRMVALTFDMGGRVDPAIDIMNWLIANDVEATIFVTGAMVENVNTNAGREVLGIIEGHPELFEVGNHSYTHPDFRTLTPQLMADELRRTEDAIAKHSKLDSRPLFRPPLGGVDDEVVSVVAEGGYDRTIMWDIDTIDWRPESESGPTAADMVSKVVARAAGGSIVLMHLGGFNTLDALPALVSQLRAKGFELVKVSAMLE
jgi:peptidoglycan/xylan/chitin deacetylase (PgdA/CDA1 family)